MIVVSPFSTQRNRNGTIDYNLRDESDIRQYVHFVLKGNKTRRPLYSTARGFRAYPSNSNDIVNEILTIQQLYNKLSGLRVRGLVIAVSKDELSAPFESQQIIRIADPHYSRSIPNNTFLNGFQTSYGIFDMGACYEIYYAINTVSFVNGMKFHQNNTDILAMQQLCAETVVAEVTGRFLQQPFNFDSLEYA